MGVKLGFLSAVSPLEVETWDRKIGDLLGGYQSDQLVEGLSRFYWGTLAREVEKCWEDKK